MRRAIFAAAMLAALVAAVGACDGTTGTYHVSLAIAPGSHVLDTAATGLLVLSDPHTTVESARGSDGSFDLDLDVDATGVNSTLTFEALDATGAVVAWGQTPPLPIAAIDSAVAIYVAAPTSLAASPVALDPPRADLAVTPLSYGAVIAGGVDEAGMPSASLAIYNAYAHDFEAGVDLPAARTQMSAAAGATGYVYLFGGDDPNGAATSSFWRFDTTVSPAGAYDDLSSSSMASYARAGASITGIGDEQFVVGGAPPLLLDGTELSVAPFTAPTTLGGVGVTAVTTTTEVAIFVGQGAGSTGVGQLSSSGFAEVPAPADALRTGHGVVTTGAGVVLAIGGATSTGPVATALKIDPTGATTVVSEVAGALETPRTGAAVGLTGSTILVAGGTDASGTVRGDAELVDAGTLAHVATIELVVPRTGAQAIPLPNGQILIAGGRDPSGATIGALELFTPAAPTSL